MNPLKKNSINPWTSIWFLPRKTLSHVSKIDCFAWILAFAVTWGAIGGFSWLWFFWFQFPEQQMLRNFWLIFLWIIGGGIYGILYLYIGSWLCKVTGKWLGGIGSSWETRVAVGWSLYPATISGIFYLIGISLSFEVILQSVFSGISLTIGIWTFLILLHMLGEAHKFSAWRSFVAVLIAFFLVTLFITLMSVLFYLVQTIKKAS
ncbi:MAG: YIP1 family protein [Chlamydiia bacterium]|nr:YIP1 family protein [Chlamydiia bacterium]